MIIAKDSIKIFLKSQPRIETFADKLGVTRATVYNILNGENVSADSIAKLLNVTGFDFEKAFEVKEEK